MARDASAWIEEIWDDRVCHALRVRERLHVESSPFQRIEVVDTDAYGRVLVLDGMFQTSERDEHYYHEMMVHPALTTAPRIDRILVVGGGDGGTVREVLRHRGVAEVVMVEIDRQVVETCRRWLPTIACAFDDGRLRMRFEDGVRHVAQAEDESYDVVLLDGSDPLGPAAGLFDGSFYREIARVLRPHGVFVTQSASYAVMGDVFTAIQVALREVFPRVHPYFGYSPLYGTGMWTWTYASRTADPLALDGERASAIERHTRYYHRGIHAGAFALPNELREQRL